MIEFFGIIILALGVTFFVVIPVLAGLAMALLFIGGIMASIWALIVAIASSQVTRK